MSNVERVVLPVLQKIDTVKLIVLNTMCSFSGYSNSGWRLKSINLLHQQQDTSMTRTVLEEEAYGLDQYFKFACVEHDSLEELELTRGMIRVQEHDQLQGFPRLKKLIFFDVRSYEFDGYIFGLLQHLQHPTELKVVLNQSAAWLRTVLQGVFFHLPDDNATNTLLDDERRQGIPSTAATYHNLKDLTHEKSYLFP